MKYTSLIILLLIAYVGSSQNIKIGQFSVGIEANMFTIKNFSPYNDDYYSRGNTMYLRDKSSSPIGFSLDYNYTIGKQISLNIGTVYSHIQNSQLNLRKSYGNLHSSVYRFDRNRIKNNLIQLNLGIKKFYRQAPLGNYFLFNLNYNIMNSTIHKSWSIASFNNFNKNVYHYAPVKASTKCFGAEFGFGFVKFLNHSIFLDYGAKVNFEFLALGKRSVENYLNSGAIDLNSSSPKLNEFNQNLLRTNMLQLFIKVGWNNINFK